MISPRALILNHYGESGPSLRRFVTALFISNCLFILLLAGVAAAYAGGHPLGTSRAIASALGVIGFTVMSQGALYSGRPRLAVSLFFIPTTALIILGRFHALTVTPSTTFTTYIYYQYFLILYLAVFGNRRSLPIVTGLFIILNIATYLLAVPRLPPEMLSLARSGIYNSTPALLLTFVMATANLWLYNQKTRDILEQIRLLQEQNEKNNALQEIIRQYIPRTTWEKADLNSSEAQLEIAEETKAISCFFLDIVDFTSYAENHEPVRVVEMLNTLFQPMVEVIYHHRGDIDKFIGDSIFAVFPQPQDCWDAALAIQKSMTDRELTIRIGMNTGEVVIGNVGGQVRKDNTLIGDTVNTASRLEKECRPGELLITDDLYRRLARPPRIYQTEDLLLRGKNETITVHRIRPGD